MPDCIKEHAIVSQVAMCVGSSTDGTEKRVAQPWLAIGCGLGRARFSSSVVTFSGTLFILLLDSILA
jgi:hypothetical protein